jgi:hypothetical protein
MARPQYVPESVSRTGDPFLPPTGPTMPQEVVLVSDFRIHPARRRYPAATSQHDLTASFITFTARFAAFPSGPLALLSSALLFLIRIPPCLCPAAQQSKCTSSFVGKTVYHHYHLSSADSSLSTQLALTSCTHERADRCRGKMPARFS